MHPKMIVGADRIQLAGQPLGESGLVQIVVLASDKPRLDPGGRPRSPAGKHIP